VDKTTQEQARHGEPKKAETIHPKAKTRELSVSELLFSKSQEVPLKSKTDFKVTLEKGYGIASWAQADATGLIPGHLIPKIPDSVTEETRKKLQFFFEYGTQDERCLVVRILRGSGCEKVKVRK
jgi:hypothetical protein